MLVAAAAFVVSNLVDTVHLVEGSAVAESVPADADGRLLAVAHRHGLHVGGVGAVVGLGDAEGEAAPALGQVVDPVEVGVDRFLLADERPHREHDDGFDVIGRVEVCGLDLSFADTGDGPAFFDRLRLGQNDFQLEKTA